MTRQWWTVPALLALFALLFARVAPAEEPPNATFSPAPPGTVVQSQLVYLAGQAMHSQWRAVASKKLLGNANGTAFYQWYLSIYQLDGTTYTLRYQSPRDGGPLAKVEKAANGGTMWFPIQTVKIVGAAQLMQPSVENLVVDSHEMAADCGGATVSIFETNAQGRVVPAASLQNGCELTASIVRGTGGANDSLALGGPYYGPDAAMCCPTKPKATATLHYRNGTWVEQPKYYQLLIGKLPAP